MTVTVTRLQDGAVLTHSQDTFMVPTASVFGAEFEKTFYAGPNGESILLSSALQAKTFTFSWISGDQTGDDQTDILEFFSRGSWFSISDTDLGLVNFEFAVLAVEPSFERPGITCQARWGSEPTMIVTNLSTQSLAGGASSAPVEQSFTNNEQWDASIRLTLDAGVNAAWNPVVGGTITAVKTPDTVGRVDFSVAKLSDRTGDPVSWRGVKFIIDSNREIVEGQGIISPINWQPFVVAPGETVTIKLTAMLTPLTSTVAPWSLKLDAVVIEGP